MKKLTHDEISKSRITLETIHDAERVPVYLLLNSIRSNYNVGSIFRTCDGAMIQKIYLCGFTPHPPIAGLPGGKKEIHKTALGATESIQWEYYKDPLEVIKKLKSEGVRIVALELTSKSIPYYKLDYNIFPACLVIGNEITGVSQEILDECDLSIQIPQYGIKQSLNVAVATGIAVFELRKIFDSSGIETKQQQ